MTHRLPIIKRPRRLRTHQNIRDLVAQTRIHKSDLVYPIFITDGATQPIKSMPHIQRLSIPDALQTIRTLYDKGIKGFAIFPSTAEHVKTDCGAEALNPDNIINTVMRSIKNAIPEVVVFADVALDPYTTHGHDGVLNAQGYVDNDKTVTLLMKQAVIQAENGADVISPSDMMDGRVGYIRKALDEAGYITIPIMSYAVKYASAFYGPFRDAVGSATSLVSDKKSYQMDYANIHEAHTEMSLDICEGADMIMIKPGMPYLDIVAKARQNTHIPICVYQVSGEYTMIQNMIDMGHMPPEAILESLVAFKRAGADIIFTYFAPQIVDVL